MSSVACTDNNNLGVSTEAQHQHGGAGVVAEGSIRQDECGEFWRYTAGKWVETTYLCYLIWMKEQQTEPAKIALMERKIAAWKECMDWS